MTLVAANVCGSVPLVGDYVGEPVGVNVVPNPMKLRVTLVANCCDARTVEHSGAESKR